MNCFLTAVALTLLSLESVRYLQGADYLPQRGYMKVYGTWYGVMLVALQVISVTCNKWIVTLLTFVFAVVVLVRKRKVPLKFTRRVIRLVVVLAVVNTCVVAVSIHAVGVLLPLWVVIAWAITLPVEALINYYYVTCAKRKLISSHCVIIAITGSYGKTSVKNMLTTLLPNAVCTPHNYNTPLGIAKFVNGTDITQYKYFVCEMGARKRHDIDKLCRMVQPTVGIITGVCAQHVRYFGSYENVVRTKRELLDYLPKECTCILNDNDGVVKTYLSYGVCNKVCVSSVVTACNTAVSANGLDFVVMTMDGEQTPVHLPVTSVGALDNYLMCVATAVTLGVSKKEIENNTANITQPPHRMQLSYNGKFYIVDDSYNASIVGVANLFKTLKLLQGDKFVIAQGIDEGGCDSEKLNKQAGALLGECCKVVVAVGKYAKHIAKGALNTGCTVLNAPNVTTAVEVVTPYVTKDGYLVFQNDLPDNT